MNNNQERFKNNRNRPVKPAGAGQKNTCPIKHNLCDTVGHVFLLGISVVATEIVELMAAKSLEYLMEPCLAKTENVVEEAAIAADVAAIELVLPEDEFIPIAFE